MKLRDTRGITNEKTYSFYVDCRLGYHNLSKDSRTIQLCPSTRRFLIINFSEKTVNEMDKYLIVVFDRPRLFLLL